MTHALSDTHTITHTNYQQQREEDDTLLCLDALSDQNTLPPPRTTASDLVSRLKSNAPHPHHLLIERDELIQIKATRLCRLWVLC